MYLWEKDLWVWVPMCLKPIRIWVCVLHIVKPMGKNPDHPWVDL